MNAARRLANFLKQHQHVHCSPGGKGFRIEGSGSACGITKLLQQTFYPNYQYTGKCKQKFDYVTGAKRGTLVDVQIRDVVRAMFDDSYQRKHKTLHAYTKKILASLKVLDLTPAYAQCYVGDSQTKVATGVDLVCLDNATKRPVVIELKMGFNGTLDAGNGFMKSILQVYPNSPRYQHQAQLAVTYELFKRTYGLEPVRCIVLNGNDKGVHFHELEPAFKKLAPAILDKIFKTRQKNI